MKKNLLLIPCISIFIAQLGMTIYLPAVPEIASDLHLNINHISWMLSSYLIGMASLMLVWGGIYDFFGEKKSMFFALIILFACSVGVTLSTNIYSLILIRFFQGVGAGGVSVIARSILRDNFRGDELAKALSYLSIAFVISLGIGQSIGSVILTILGWKYIFYILALGSLMSMLLLPAKKYNHSKNEENSVYNYINLLKNKHYIYAVFIGGIGYGAIISFNIMAPLIFKFNFGWSESQYGIIGIPISISYLLGTIILNRYIVYCGRTNLMKIGIILILIGGVVMFVGSIVGGILEIILYSAYFLVVLGQAINYPISLSIASDKTSITGSSVMALIGFIHQIIAAFVGGITGLFSYKESYLLPLTIIVLSSFSLFLFYKINKKSEK
ncbi:MFS transporter [Photorhabdus asymbiotica]|uniref:MFS transporter n=1 Tax=Photorhabdus asymbiotica TaxID=291112 RepID=UPI003DA70879